MPCCRMPSQSLCNSSRPRRGIPASTFTGNGFKNLSDYDIQFQEIDQTLLKFSLIYEFGLIIFIILSVNKWISNVFRYILIYSNNRENLIPCIHTRTNAIRYGVVRLLVVFHLEIVQVVVVLVVEDPDAVEAAGWGAVVKVERAIAQVGTIVCEPKHLNHIWGFTRKIKWLSSEKSKYFRIYSCYY